MTKRKEAHTTAAECPFLSSAPTVVALLLLFAAHQAHAQFFAGYTNAVQVSNDSAGTTENNLACFDATAQGTTCTVANFANGVIGVVVGGAGATGVASIVQTGNAACQFDSTNPISAGDAFVGSTNSGHVGQCLDIGTSYAPGVQLLGRVQSATAVASGLYPVSVSIQTGYGSVGVGTYAPLYPFAVVNSDAGAAFYGNATNYPFLNVFNTANTTGYRAYVITFDHNRFALNSATDSGGSPSPQFAIFPDSGEVFIGSSPAEASPVKPTLSLGAATKAQELLLYDANDFNKYGFGIQSFELRQFYPSNAFFTMGTISTTDGATFSEKLRLNSSGYLGIGTSSPLQLLSVGATSQFRVDGTGDAIAATYNGLAITNNGGNTLNIAASTGLTISSSLTLAGGGGSTYTFPGASDTVATLTATQTLTNKTLSNPAISTPGDGSIALNASAIPSGTTQTANWPNTSGTAPLSSFNTITYSAAPTIGTAHGSVQSLTIPSGSGTVSPTIASGSFAGQTFTFYVANSSTASTVNYPANMKGYQTIAMTGSFVQDFFWNGANWIGKGFNSF